jgi:two-component system chemotaxis response regulator CheY
MYDQRLSNRENHRQFEGVSAPPAINIRVHRNEGNMPLAELMLRRINFKNVVAEEDGEQAWAHLNLVRYDFILSDWNMEPMDGLELLRCVRANRHLSKIPVVLMSADLSLNSWREAIDAGATDFLLKPFTLEQLRETVQIALSTPSADRANVIQFPEPQNSRMLERIRHPRPDRFC